MKTLLLNPPKYRDGTYVVREECAIGTVATNFLPSQIFLAAAYLREKGKDADALEAEPLKVSFQVRRRWEISVAHYNICWTKICSKYGID